MGAVTAKGHGIYGTGGPDLPLGRMEASDRPSANEEVDCPPPKRQRSRVQLPDFDRVATDIRHRDAVPRGIVTNVGRATL